MPRLDDRLKTVAEQIRYPVHIDIGSDHGHLIAALLAAGRIERGIAVENKRQPMINSLATLAGMNAEVRFGDALDVIDVNEADGISLCGMGGRNVARILDRFPERVPRRLIAQVNSDPDQVRLWCLANGYHVADEIHVTGKRCFDVLVFDHVSIFGDPKRLGTDPAYQGIDRRAAILFGPLTLRRGGDDFRRRLIDELAYWDGLAKRRQTVQCRLDVIRDVLATLAIPDPSSSH